MSKVGVMICGHGSRDVNAVTEFDAVARGLRERLPQYQVESGFLEFATPIIRDGLDKLHAARHDLVLAVPGMLFAAGHAKNDIPSVLRTYEASHPGHGDPVRPRARHRSEDAQGGGRSDSTDARPGKRRRRVARHHAGGGGARHVRLRRELQRQQGDAHAVGGLRVRMGRGLLLRGDLPPGRARTAPRGPARLPPHRRLSLLPVHRRARQAHLRPHRQGGGGESGDRIPEGRLPQRPPHGARRVHGIASTRS